MITLMDKYSFILLSGDRDRFLDEIQELGVVDIKRSSKAVDEVSGSIVSEMEALKGQIREIQNCSDKLSESLKTRIAELGRSLSEARPWGRFDREAVKRFGIRLYACARKAFDTSWAENYALEIISEDKNKIYFAVAGDAKDFPLKEIALPAKDSAELEKEIAELKSQLEQHSAELASRKGEIPVLQELIDKKCSELSLYLAGATGKSAAEGSLVLFEGFAPRENSARLCEALDKMDIYYIKEEATAEDKPPIKLKNNAFVRQFETFTRMYGMPVYNEFDPTIFLSIFYLLFFAICMGDAGYGLLLIGIGLALKGRKGGLADMWSLIVTLGAGTVVVGLIMATFFGINLYDAAWVPAGLKKIMIVGDISVGGAMYSKQMVLSLGIGVLHICLAMLTKAVWAVKRDGFKHSLGTLGWTLLIVGSVIGLSIGLTGVISETAMKFLLIGIGAVSALGIFIFNKWGRNPLVNIGSGLWDTYNMASGLMGDVLSYVRLYALGLSGGMLGQTFNLIADMVKGTDPTWQWIPFVIILLFGHVLNLGLCALGAFVHPLRLNFVEFFKNAGYEGQGVEYNPVRK
ncbi:MAG: V-type ATPase 116kDa subunit family protein [Candidatus Cryptobacteroides sp.]|nr:V-type ATPase 116kDa subunit family protein [Rikenellaceae bacterium]MDY5747324.1 V-type ATPase 116kDa subunit family protein [Candidatus Cryptobacteroides sp.]